MNKYLITILAGALMLPFVSFAQVSSPTNADILQKISALEAEVQILQQELAQIVATEATPSFGGVATTTPKGDPIERCDLKYYYQGDILPKSCKFDFEIGG